MAVVQLWVGPVVLSLTLLPPLTQARAGQTGQAGWTPSVCVPPSSQVVVLTPPSPWTDAAAVSEKVSETHSLSDTGYMHAVVMSYMYMYMHVYLSPCTWLQSLRVRGVGPLWGRYSTLSMCWEAVVCSPTISYSHTPLRTHGMGMMLRSPSPANHRFAGGYSGM